MLKTFITSTLTALALTTGAFATDIKTLGDATFKLWNDNSPVCSATFVESTDKRDLLLTAGHCVVKDGKGYNIRKSVYDKDLNVTPEERFYLKVVKEFEKEDVATLEVIDAGITNFPVVDVATVEEANNALTFGAPVLTVSYPDGSELTAMDGVFTGKMKDPITPTNTTLVNKATPSVYGGSSGGGFYAKVGDTWKLAGTVMGSHGEIDIFNVFSLPESVVKVIELTSPETVKETLANK